MNTPLQKAFVAFSIQLAKAEVLAMIENGTMPASVATFGDLHSHCDANELGNLCQYEAWVQEVIAPRVGADDTEYFPHRFSELLSEIQDKVNAWLVAGRQEPKQFRDMSDAERLAWGRMEAATRITEIKAARDAGDPFDMLENVKDAARERRRAIGATTEQATAMVIEANREARRAVTQ